MPIKVLMPALSPTMTEGKLSKWIKKEGEAIRSGDIIAEIETDKATMEYEATEEGILGKILVSEGTEGVKVNDIIGVMLEEGEEKASIEDFLASIKSSNSELPKVQTNEPNKASSTVSIQNIALQPISANKGNKIFITPLAKRIAEQNTINITNLKGTGPNGRIIKQDIENIIKSPSSISSVSVIQTTLGGHVSGSYEDKQNSSMRKTIAKRLLESKTTIPHYYLTIDCDMDTILQSRALLNKVANDKYKLSVNDFIIKAVALAMRDVPEGNASWQGETTRFFLTSDVAVAVATPTGLITPIIREADKKGLIHISNEMKDLAKKAKEGKLQPSEYQGGGFSISNLGMFGIKEFSAIVNPPQVGILAIGATEQRPVVKNDIIVVGNIMSVTLSADHRILDGAVGAKFLNAFKMYLENPVSMIL